MTSDDQDRLQNIDDAFDRLVVALETEDKGGYILLREFNGETDASRSFSNSQRDHTSYMYRLDRR